ncbi:MAG: hypothetical protein U5R14_06540 [Gemmatimonadota bacterium]|nr:hypothetical protein [Gemmatimonadota bacterium]
MFEPMAFTITFALVAAILLALTYTPVVTSYFSRSCGKDEEPRLPRWFKARFRARGGVGRQAAAHGWWAPL